MKIFLATSFPARVFAAGKANAATQALVEKILFGLRRAQGHEVFCDIEHENWGVSGELPEDMVQKNLAELESSDVVVFYTQEAPSVAAQFLLGYAVARGKRTILVCKADHQLEIFNQGVVSAGMANFTAYDDAESLMANLTLAVNAANNQE